MKNRALVLALSCSLAASTAFAQSDQDRAAARQLAETAVKLKAEGKHAEALDKLQRAQSLVDAPTHLLLIAQSQAALGQLVEAAETYRKLGRMPVDPKAPPAFKKAQEAGAKELADLEPKIPLLTLNVDPANAKDLVVKVDGAVVPAALIGVERPTNPGERQVEVTATGFEPQKLTVTLTTGARKSEKITLKAGNNAAAVVAPLPPPSGTGNQQPPPAQPPPPPPNGYGEPPPPPPAAAAEGRKGMFLRFGIGAASISSDVKAKVDTTEIGLGNFGGIGPSGEFSLGGTVSPGLVLGGTFLFNSLSSASSYTAPSGASLNLKESELKKIKHTYGMLGGLVEWFPSKTSGLHLGGIAGVAVSTLEGDVISSGSGDQDKVTGSGLGLGVHAGYDLKVGGWTAGVLGRFASYSTEGKLDDPQTTTSSVKLLTDASVLSLLVTVTNY